MDFGLTDEQEQLADAERSWLQRHDPIGRVRAALDTAPVTIDEAAVVHSMESGLLDLLSPDMGGCHVDLAVLSEAHGYAASSLPLADLAIARWVLDLAGRPATGDALTGLARASAEHAPLSSPVPMAADMAAFAVVVVDDDDGEYVGTVYRPSLIEMSTLDLTRTWARLDRDAMAEDAVSLPPGTAAQVRDALAVHRGLDALGAAARLLEMTVVYAGQRQQFGVPIGSFQAVKHHCADMAVGVEAGRSALWAAALALDSAITSAARSRAASAGAAYAKAAASDVAGLALQVHGGIGFTWEHDLHLLLRRIKVDEAMDGTVAEHRRSLLNA